MSTGTVLDCIAITKADHISWCADQLIDSITNGAFMIRRQALTNKTNPKFRKIPRIVEDALKLPITTVKHTIGSVLKPYKLDDLIQIEMIADTLRVENTSYPYGIERTSYPMIDFRQKGGNLIVTLNAHYAKLLLELFPYADWFSLGQLRPVVLIDKGEVLACICPIQSIKYKDQYKKPVAT